MRKKDYLRFFGLKDEPFRLTPDTKYFFPSRSHRAALEVLKYGLKTGEGFLVLTGEPGSGKTMLLRILLKDLSPKTEIALILTPTLNGKELIEAILNDLNITYDFNDNKERLLRIFQHYLLGLAQRGHQLLVVIDEAQNLPEESLEELRLLSNLETEERKLLQIFLIGQPLLKEKLTTPTLAQLAQRISIWENITPLEKEETEAYIHFRFLKAGGGPLKIEREALKKIYFFTQGLPRLVNKLMDRVLLLAASEKKDLIEASLVLEAAQTFGPLYPAPEKPGFLEKLTKYLPTHFFNYSLLWAKFGL